MEITEVRIKLLPFQKGRTKLRGFCSITLDDEIVVRDLKIIDGGRGPFVAMPSRKLADRCPACRGKNHRRARFCNDCGKTLGGRSVPKDESGRVQLYVDVAHPINSAARRKVHDCIMRAFDEEVERARRETHYVYADADADDLDDLYDDARGDAGGADPAGEHEGFGAGA